MATTATKEAPEDAAPKQRKITASGALLVLSGLAVVGTLLLWWLGTLPDEPEIEVGRHVFGNIPGPIIALFYVSVAVFLGVSIYLMAQRAKSWERGSWENRSGMMKKRLHELREGLAMRTLLRDRNAGLMHSAIYYGFIVLFLGTVTLEIDHLLPNNLKFLHGTFYQGYSFVLDLFAVVFLGRHRLGGGASLRDEAMAPSLQDQARRCRHPHHPRAHRRHRAAGRGRPHRRSGTARLRDLVVCRLPHELPHP